MKTVSDTPFDLPNLAFEVVRDMHGNPAVLLTTSPESMGTRQSLDMLLAPATFEALRAAAARLEFVWLTPKAKEVIARAEAANGPYYSDYLPTDILSDMHLACREDWLELADQYPTYKLRQQAIALYIKDKPKS